MQEKHHFEQDKEGKVASLQRLLNSRGRNWNSKSLAGNDRARFLGHISVSLMFNCVILGKPPKTLSFYFLVYLVVKWNSESS